MFNFIKEDDIRIVYPNIKRRYKVIILGDMTMGAFSNRTKVETEWILSIQQIYNDSSVMLELITFDSDVVESSNEAFKELSVAANQFKKVTQEVVCVVKKDGNLLHLINTEQIKEKWNRVKNEIMTFNGMTTDLEDFLKVNNERFSSDDVLKELTNQLEFFKVYFNGLYGTHIPMYGWRQSENAFKTNTLDYEVEYTKSEDKQLNKLRVEFKSIDYKIGKRWIETAYKGFPLLVDTNTCKPEFNIEGNYLFDKKTGLIDDAIFIWEENVSDTLKLKTEYQISTITM